ncbi:MAG TPA: hypothetical protein VJ347_06645 [Streptosporangiaceae bacterium]|nr:hypothetical protein [Streptosporangiaceae bacterium]
MAKALGSATDARDSGHGHPAMALVEMTATCIVLNGTSCSGKSSIAAALQELWPSPHGYRQLGRHSQGVRGSDPCSAGCPLQRWVMAAIP